jgi:DNA polymerase elongation subunit (family B)
MSPNQNQSRQSSYAKEGGLMEILNPKILVLDIETSPMLAYVWALKDQNITLSQIKEDWHVMAWAAKWLRKAKVIYRDQRNAPNPKDDKTILAVLWKMLDEADIVITQNGTNFDGPKLNARFIMHGMKPPSPYKHLDTYQIVRRAAKFSSNKLEYLTDKLCTKYKKLAHTEYPGFSLWTECLKGNRSAWNEMKKYNIHDVLATEELYSKLQAWAPENAPKPFVVTDTARQCSTCGYMGQMREGQPRRAKTRLYKQHSCLKCGSWQKGEFITDKKAV